MHVVHENMDFWLEKSVFALRCENAVAIEKTFLYADPALTQKLESPQSPLKFAEKIAKAKDTADGETTPAAETKFSFMTRKINPFARPLFRFLQSAHEKMTSWLARLPKNSK